MTTFMYYCKPLCVCVYRGQCTKSFKEFLHRRKNIENFKTEVKLKKLQ